MCQRIFRLISNDGRSGISTCSFGHWSRHQTFTKSRLTGHHHFDTTRNMKTNDAIAALSALAHETRLDVFRYLMRHLPAGVPAGELSDQFGVAPSTMSAHLAILTRAGLIISARDGRTINYRAEHEGIRTLLEFLVKDCCNGKPNACNKLLQAALNPCC